MTESELIEAYGYMVPQMLRRLRAKDTEQWHLYMVDAESESWRGLVIGCRQITEGKLKLAPTEKAIEGYLATVIERKIIDVKRKQFGRTSRQALGQPVRPLPPRVAFTPDVMTLEAYLPPYQEDPLSSVSHDDLISQLRTIDSRLPDIAQALARGEFYKEIAKDQKLTVSKLRELMVEARSILGGSYPEARRRRSGVTE